MMGACPVLINQYGCNFDGRTVVPRELQEQQVLPDRIVSMHNCMKPMRQALIPKIALHRSSSTHALASWPHISVYWYISNIEWFINLSSQKRDYISPILEASFVCFDQLRAHVCLCAVYPNMSKCNNGLESANRKLYIFYRLDGTFLITN